MPPPPRDPATAKAIYDIWLECRSFTEAGRRMGRKTGERWDGVKAQRYIEEHKRLENPAPPPPLELESARHAARLGFDIEDGIVLIGSDAHYWPGPATTAHRAFVNLCKELKPRIVIKNGDALDGATVSRHASIGWESRPLLVDEIEACKERMGEIWAASKSAQHVWPLGNHDGRFETRLATVAPEYARVNGVHLKDHFPDWQGCWSAWINDNVVVKHRFKAGIHAPHNNTMWAGKTIITGHLHSLKVMPLSDYNGTRWGVDCGTLADPQGPQFQNYLEMSPTNWRAGFVVLTFYKGRLLWPEIVHVLSEKQIEFRGQVYNV